jgi:hypothetical protein
MARQRRINAEDPFVGDGLLVILFVVSGCSGGVDGPVIEGNQRFGGTDAEVFGEVVIEASACIWLRRSLIFGSLLSGRMAQHGIQSNRLLCFPAALSSMRGTRSTAGVAATTRRT